MGESIETGTIETGLRGAKEQADAEERRLERALAPWKAAPPQTVRSWKAPINNKPLTLPASPAAASLPPSPPAVGRAASRGRDNDVLAQLGFSPSTAAPLLIDATAGPASVVANDAAGAFPSYKVKVPVGGASKTVGLFKPVPAEAEGAVKEAPCFKQPGACEAREVLSSAWNDACGGLGDYPTTVPASVTLPAGPQTGSVMAWRDGAQEFSSFVALAPWKEAMLESENDIADALRTQPSIELNLDTKRTLNQREFEDLIASIKEEKRALPAKKANALGKISDDDAQSLMGFHIGTLQLDVENASNIMFQDAPDGGVHLMAIDGGLSAPDKVVPNDLNPPCWLDWPQSNKPWTGEQKAKFAAMPPSDEIARTVSEKLGPLSDKVNPAAMHRTMVATEILRWMSKLDATPKQTFLFTKNYCEILAFSAEQAIKKDPTKAFPETLAVVAQVKFRELARLPMWTGLPWDRLTETT